EGGQRPDHVVVAGAAYLVQRPGAVLAARPGDQRLGPSHRRVLGPPRSLMTASAARSPDSQAPPTVPQSVSCAASPARKMRLPSGSMMILRADCAPGAAADEAPSTHGSLFQRVAWRRLTTAFMSLP